MKFASLPLLVIPLLLCVAKPLAAHEILARRETANLSAADRSAAASAEYEALERDEIVYGFLWHGSDGAEGFLSVSGEFPSVYGMGGCRRLMHIIRHPGDGGVNPTFDGTVCRSWDGKWSVKER